MDTQLIETLVLVGHVIVAAAVIGLVLIQHGKGADAGASFGAGASQTVFGSQGSGSFLTKLTSWFATIFFLTSFGLAVFAKQHAGEALDDGIPVPQAIESVQDDAESAAEPAIPDLESGSGSAPADNVQPDLE